MIQWQQFKLFNLVFYLVLNDFRGYVRMWDVNEYYTTCPWLGDKFPGLFHSAGDPSSLHKSLVTVSMELLKKYQGWIKENQQDCIKESFLNRLSDFVSNFPRIGYPYRSQESSSCCIIIFAQRSLSQKHSPYLDMDKFRGLTDRINWLLKYQSLV